ncbi:MiaB/RimO family radical SAM methylthiotransferase [bacterium]|nr:MiaB/RimO family radical SAM methylthiotransferase [bacterium]
MQNKITFSIITFGCKINQYESNEFFAEMVSRGFCPENEDSIADVIIINSCSVTNKTEKKILKKTRKLRRERSDCYIVLAGCFGEVYPEDIKKKGNVDYVTGNLKRSNLIEFLNNRFLPEIIESSNILSSCVAIKRTRSFLKVTDGCNNKCTYCVIWKARGKIISESIEKVALGVRKAIDDGFKEIVLLGTQLSCYGNDIGTSLSVLIEKLYDEFGSSGIMIRLSSLEPVQINIFQSVIEYIRKGFICRHLHIPVQSMADSVLKGMHRNYSVADIFELFEMFKDIPKISIGVDIITGFPGETETEFFETLENLKKLKPLSYIHVFPFSPKKDTPAETYSEQVNGKDKKGRATILNDLSDQLRRSFYSKFINTTLEALIEEMKKDDIYEATTDNFVKILVRGASEKNINKIEKIEIVDITGYNTTLRLTGLLRPE